ncbi:MAG: deoxyguanosinetriphosphate triphosphohydrolase [Hyphomicrobiales bacterium]|nr:deoxyguanosinetriphosphate triphosphohydrolase [Hyphomicrobiales bacterium]
MFEKIGFGRRGLARYACIAANSKGRFYEEDESPTRTPFQRDRDRVIHSTTFRRLKHKTQVFVYHEGDHYRTRLTHSIEVAQIARSLARALQVDEDLAETLALAHDFGHTPFGHAGEIALDEVMKDYGGFDHNAQSLRCVTKLERQYAEFDGLNLTWESLEGLVKHNGPVVVPGMGGGRIPYAIAEFNELYDLELDRYSSLEAQCAAIADDIAYDAHDLDDGIRAGLFDLDNLEELPFIGETLMKVRKQYPGLDAKRVAHEIVRRQITAMVEDVIRTTVDRLERIKPDSDSDIRNAGRTIVTFSDQMAITETAIKVFLYEHMYRAENVIAVRENAQIIVRNLFKEYFNGDGQMPNDWELDWQDASRRMDDKKRARLVSDFLAGMTDNFAIAEHRRLFDVTPDLG